MNTKIYSQCLSNTPNLDLGSIQLRFFGDSKIPSLMTIYEIIYPIDIASPSIEKNIIELQEDNLREGAINGLFVLGISNFEIMISDLLKRFLFFFPYKLTILNSENKTRQEKSEFKISKDNLMSSEILNNIINKEVDKMSYGNIVSLLNEFIKIFDIPSIISEDDLDKLIEIKETRNLLLHNNLIVNDKYLSKTKNLKRSIKPGDRISIDKEYALDSLSFVLEIVKTVEIEILQKYSKYTLLEMLKKLWNYTFKLHIKMEDHFMLNIEEDIYDGPYKESKYSLSSSEIRFLQIWKAQRFSSGIDNFSLVHLTSDNSRKIAFLVEVFGSLRLTHW